uniref:Uncharacterized protein n=1 Tax=Anguilla anguilla TaxID=7936 RepID=A0A0E9WT92_ANGAN
MYEGLLTPSQRVIHMHQTWVKYAPVLDSNAPLRPTDLAWCIGTNDILSKSASPAFRSYWQAQLRQARSIEHRKAFESKTNTSLTQVRYAHRAFMNLMFQN